MGYEVGGVFKVAVSMSTRREGRKTRGQEKKMKKLHSSRNSYLSTQNGECVAYPRAKATALQVKDGNKRHKDGK